MISKATIVGLLASTAVLRSMAAEPVDSLFSEEYLQQVVVTGTRSPKMLAKSPVLTHVITAKDIEKSDATNIRDLLQQVMPGVEFSYSMNQMPHMNFSGFSGQSMLILVDGERLAGETMEDVEGIADLALKIEKLYFDTMREIGSKPRKPEITVSTSMFIPKPFTPFQWEDQNTKEEFLEKQSRLRDLLRKHRNIRYIWHDVETSCWEGIYARGDRRLCPVILEGYKAGSIFDAWDQFFDYGKWHNNRVGNLRTFSNFYAS